MGGDGRGDGRQQVERRITAMNCQGCMCAVKQSVGRVGSGGTPGEEYGLKGQAWDRRDMDWKVDELMAAMHDGGLGAGAALDVE